MEYITELTLDVNLHKELPTVRVKQGDASTRKLLITLKKDGDIFVPDSGCWVLFRCEKPDGHAVVIDSRYQDPELGRHLVINNGNGTISVELVAQVTVISGSCRCDICLLKNEEVLSSIPFVIDVKRSPNTTNLTASSDDRRILINTSDIADGAVTAEKLDGDIFADLDKIDEKENSSAYISYTESNGAVTCNEGGQRFLVVRGPLIINSESHSLARLFLESGKVLDTTNIRCTEAARDGIVCTFFDGDTEYVITDNSVGVSMTSRNISNPVTIDSDFSTTSENPVQNKVITSALNQAAMAFDNIATYKADKSELPEASDNAPSSLGLAADSGSSDDYSRADHVHPMPSAADVGALPDSTTPSDIGALPASGDAYRAASIPMGQLDNSSTATVMTATVPGITELRDGVCMWLKNGVVTSANGFTLNINNLGAKPVYGSLAAATRATTAFNVNYTMLFVYNGDRVTGGCWDMVYGYDTNTTYTPPKLGFGYAVCSTAAATVAKTASISNYALTAGGIVAIQFSEDVPFNATLNITSKGAKAIYYHGLPIAAGIIKAGDTVTMIYNTYYHVLSIDRDEAPVTSVNGQTGAVQIDALPAVTSSDNGKFLCVDNGVWAAVTVPSAAGVSF